jgi:hypothetical protein
MKRKKERCERQSYHIETRSANYKQGYLTIISHPKMKRELQTRMIENHITSRDEKRKLQKGMLKNHIIKSKNEAPITNTDARQSHLIQRRSEIYKHVCYKLDNHIIQQATALVTHTDATQS